MAKNLVIVESPAKAKTIEGYLGSDFVVKSSYGHVADLPKHGLNIDIEHGFIPHYEINEDKLKVVSELKSLAKKAEIIWLATDDDREGEAISWHLKESLNLKDEETRRIVFREITKTAVLKAIDNPRKINQDLVNAQQARRVLDRLVGFELSPLLWKKIRRGLSAGRVQSVAVRIIVEREREIEKHKSKAVFKVSAVFTAAKGRPFKAELKERFEKETDALAFVNSCLGADFIVQNLETKPAKRTPAPPFTTSTLQQEASNKLGFSVLQTMTVAQRLYEAGHITYMRTDSVNLSETAIDAAVKQITSAYGDNFVHVRRFKTKSESAQEAHEAIRPTDFSQRIAGGERNEQRLYELIWRRAIASQMADAELERTVATISVSKRPEVFVANGEVIKFEGFLKVYMEHIDTEEHEEFDVETDEKDAKDTMLPAMSIGQNLDNQLVKASERYSKPPARYNEASLVKKLEEMGIGRPSTYAPTITTIIKREYVLKETREGKTRKIQEITLKNNQVITSTVEEKFGSEKNKLFPTDIGMVVNDFLVQHFSHVIDFNFTANVENEFDQIANGKVVWNQMIASFYKDFHKNIETGENIAREDISTRRDLGMHPETGSKIFARLGKFGPLVQIGDPELGETPQFANLPKDERIETITLEKALELFRLPKEVGLYEEKVMVVADGRFGPYIRHDAKFYSLPKGEDPHGVEMARAIEIIEAKRKADAEKLIKEFPENAEVKILNGRWGPYITVGKQNVKIPKDLEATELTLEKCLELSKEALENPPKGSKRFPAKTTAATETKKPAAKAKTTTIKSATTKTTTTTKAKTIAAKTPPKKK